MSQGRITSTLGPPRGRAMISADVSCTMLRPMGAPSSSVISTAALDLKSPCVDRMSARRDARRAHVPDMSPASRDRRAAAHRLTRTLPLSLIDLAPCQQVLGFAWSGRAKKRVAIFGVFCRQQMSGTGTKALPRRGAPGKGVASGTPQRGRERGCNPRWRPPGPHASRVTREDQNRLESDFGDRQALAITHRA